MSNFVTLCEHCHREVELLKDENHFDEILINKIEWESGDVTMLVYAKSLEYPFFKFYDKNGKARASYNFSDYGQKLTSQFFKGCKKLDDYIDNKAIMKELEEVANYFNS